MLSEHLDIDRKINLLNNKEPICRELGETFKNVEIQRRRFLKDLDNSINRFKVKYGGYIQHATNRRRSIHNISCRNSTETINPRNSMPRSKPSDSTSVHHSMPSNQFPGRRHSDPSESVNREIEGRLLSRRRSMPNHNIAPSSHNKDNNNPTVETPFCSKPIPPSNKDSFDQQSGVTNEKDSKFDNRILEVDNRKNTRRHSEPNFIKAKCVISRKDRRKSVVVNPNTSICINEETEKEEDSDDDKVADLTSNCLLTALDENQDGDENDKSKEKQTTPRKTSKWSRVKDLTMDDKVNESQKSSLFDLTLKLCPKIKKQVEFGDVEISNKAEEEMKPKWQLLRRKSLMIGNSTSTERVSTNELETICPKLEDHELEMNTLQSLLRFRKGHKKFEIVARLLHDHIRTEAAPSSDLKEGAWKAALSACRYLR